MWTSEDFTICIYCGELFPLVPPEGEARHDKQAKDAGEPCPRIPPAVVTDEPLKHKYPCYTCGKREDFSVTKFSWIQKFMGWKARCKTCLSGQFSHPTKKRYAPYRLNAVDHSLGQQLHSAVQRNDIVDVRRLLLLQGANPNHIAQRIGLDFSFSKNHSFQVPVWNAIGEPRPGLRVGEPNRALELVGYKAIALIDSHADDPSSLALIAEALINAGADLNPLIRFMGFSIIPSSAEPVVVDTDRELAVQVMQSAMRSIQNILTECLALQQEDKDFDFYQYFINYRHHENRVDDLVDADFVLSERAILASSDLCPFYQKHTFRRAVRRFLSHSKQLIPSLPKGLEAHIRAMAVTSGEDGILASRIPNPL